MERLVISIPGSLGTMFLDKTVLNCSISQRLEVIIRNKEQKKGYVVDKETTANMASARQRKVDRYTEKEWIEDKDYDTI